MAKSNGSFSKNDKREKRKEKEKADRLAGVAYRQKLDLMMQLTNGRAMLLLSFAECTHPVMAVKCRYPSTDAMIYKADPLYGKERSVMVQIHHTAMHEVECDATCTPPITHDTLVAPEYRSVLTTFNGAYLHRRATREYSSVRLQRNSVGIWNVIPCPWVYKGHVSWALTETLAIQCCLDNVLAHIFSIDLLRFLHLFIAPP